MLMGCPTTGGEGEPPSPEDVPAASPRSGSGSRETPRERYLRRVARGDALGRTVAFSDAVFAIAMTVLVLELHIPDVSGEQLPAALLELTPSYLTFVLSFVVVGIIWMSHHRKFSVIVRYDQTLLRLNL